MFLFYKYTYIYIDKKVLKILKIRGIFDPVSNSTNKPYRNPGFIEKMDSRVIFFFLTGSGSETLPMRTQNRSAKAGESVQMPK